MTEDNGASPGGQAAAGVVIPPCLAVVVGQAGDAGPPGRVDAPDRLLRIWALLGNAADDLRQASLSAEMTARLRRQLDAIVAELETTLSPALADELHRLTGREKEAGLSPDELRIDYATLLAWTASLLVEVLSQLDAAGARTAPGVSSVA